MPEIELVPSAADLPTRPDRCGGLFDDGMLVNRDIGVAPPDCGIRDEVLSPEGASRGVDTCPAVGHLGRDIRADPVDVGCREIGELVRPGIAGLACRREVRLDGEAPLWLSGVNVDQAALDELAVLDRGRAEDHDGIDLPERYGQAL